MRIVDRYLTKQVLIATLFGVSVLCMVLLFGNLFREIRHLLVEQGAPLSVVLTFVSFVLPFSLKFTLPWGFLTAILLVFGRLSSDTELTAMRMGGLGLSRMARPILLLGFALSLFCLWINADVAPKSSSRIAELIFNTASRDPNALLQEGQLLTQFSGQQMLIESRHGEELTGFHLYQDATAEQPKVTVHAHKVKLSFDETNKILTLTLRDATIETLTEEGDVQMVLVEEMPWRLDLSKIGKKRAKASHLTNTELHHALASPTLEKKNRVKYHLELSKRYAFSFACLALGAVGLPLAVRQQRRDTSTGFGIGIALAVGYFLTMSITESQYKEVSLLNDLLLWIPNLLCAILSIYLFRRARYR